MSKGISINQNDFNNLILNELSEIKKLLEQKSRQTDDYLRPKDVCRIFQISRTKFDNLKRSGLFPTKKIGKDVIVLRSDLEKFFSQKNQ